MWHLPITGLTPGWQGVCGLGLHHKMNHAVKIVIWLSHLDKVSCPPPTLLTVSVVCAAVDVADITIGKYSFSNTQSQIDHDDDDKDDDDNGDNYHYWLIQWQSWWIATNPLLTQAVVVVKDPIEVPRVNMCHYALQRCHQNHQKHHITPHFSTIENLRVPFGTELKKISRKPGPEMQRFQSWCG